ncbi:MAG: bifunctional phosphopantothenoylcysteine decarboxylase/phosphopantothenate--cysteine ligase CoaBC [Bacteroidota bacterium]
MSQLHGKHILLGISGSIAAYKAAFLVRLLVKAGADVKVLMTPSAAGFITPLTLSTLSKNPVLQDVSNEESWNNHVELGLWADAMLIAPATANTLAKMANGICDNMLSAVYLSARCPVFFAPAMDLDMWKHPSTQANVARMLSYGDHLIPVEHGELASGLVGPGRMAEPEHIVSFLEQYFEQSQLLEGQHIVITAGPTYEPIDPVRFIGNRSSGKMGVALAEAAAQWGATVDLVLGPSALRPTHPSIHLRQVETAQEMFEAAKGCFEKASIGILAAAVSDYRPAQVAAQKIKKSDGQPELVLVENPDIAAHLGKNKRADQLLIGFALETNNELRNAHKKLAKKNFDFIVLNSLKHKGAGFNHDTNKISIVYKDNKIKEFELKSKDEVAQDILNELVILIKQSTSND